MHQVRVQRAKGSDYAFRDHIALPVTTVIIVVLTKEHSSVYQNHTVTSKSLDQNYKNSGSISITRSIIGSNSS